MFRPSCRFIILFLLSSLLLTGCQSFDFSRILLPPERPKSRSLTILNPTEFAMVAKRFKPELIQRGFLDEQGRPRPNGHTHPGEYRPQSYGKDLHTRLSMRFLWPKEERLRTSEEVTHATIPSASEEVIVDDTNLTINGEFGSDSYRMVAVMDWDDDGQRDWIVRYRYIPKMDGMPSTRLMVIPHPGPKGILDARVIEAFECDGGKCFSYTGEALPQILGYDPLLD